MKFLHTSDWHLGRTLHGADLSDAFTLWCDHVVELARTRDLDAVLIAGDVFDRGIPPVTMVRLLSETLQRLSQYTTVVLTPGNHDAPTRLGFTAGLLKDRVVIVPDPRKAGEPIDIIRGGELVGQVYALPYLEPDIDRVRLAEDPDEPLARSHEAVVKAAMDLVREDIVAHCDVAVPRIVMAHEFVVGGEPSDSERDLHIGGVDSVPSAVFDVRVGGNSMIDYVALGHLHGPQQVNEEPLMRYAGSPIAFSFSEEHHHKSSAIVTIDAPGDTPDVELIPAPIYRPLATIRGTFDELLSDKYSAYQDHFVRIYVTDTDRPPRMVARLRLHFPHLLEVQHDVEFHQLSSRDVTRAGTNPLDVLNEFFTSAGGRELHDEERALIASQWESLAKGEE
ncbi:exonuclease SbcCD subunit D [Arcanobacterium buesumense]|uniref:Nuclease SbcCD subunit D n=1 Tax=Arcanobacterium buesumense TaxID=2722751 RepID=A0A6H2EJF5_9ACTO|nr:exonuclease SbcCD subunit D [Arcanobacterium buesumense]QJC21330.1 exonuclease SbcCD subunit D [Arcanobacterium buesumense]